VLVALSAGGSSAVEWERVQSRFTVENDVGMTDQHYTNGLRYEAFSARQGGGKYEPGGHLTFGLRTWLNYFKGTPNTEDVQRGWAIGQNFYTPADIHTPDLQVNDRPYAAILYLGRIWKLKTDNATQWTEVNLGIAGPLALGESVQKGWHEVINIAQPQGWDNQISTWPVIQWSTRVRTKNWGPLKIGEATKTVKKTELLGFSALGSLSAGSVMVSGQGGLAMQAGYNTRQVEAGIPDTFVADGPRKPGPNWHLFAEATVRYTLRPWSIFLDGTPAWRYPRSHHVTGETGFEEYEFALHFGGDSYELVVSHVRRGSEFKGADAHGFWSASLILY